MFTPYHPRFTLKQSGRDPEITFSQGPSKGMLSMQTTSFTVSYECGTATISLFRDLTPDQLRVLAQQMINTADDIEKMNEELNVVYSTTSEFSR